VTVNKELFIQTCLN